MRDKELYQIITTYKNKLESKFTENILSIDIIHNDEDLVIRCYQREILLCILKYHEENYKIGGFYRESILGKVILLRVKAIKDIYMQMSFDDIYKYYKIEFTNRIDKIISKYDLIVNLIDREKYNILKEDYIKCINKNSVDIHEYYKLRERFEKIRDVDKFE